MHDDTFDFNHLMNGLAATLIVGFALVLAPTAAAVPVLVALAYTCGRLGGRDAGLASVSTGALLFGYAITEPHFRWAIDRPSDVMLLFVLLVTAAVAAEAGVRRRLRRANYGRRARQEPVTHV